jgi:hypothetical protein
MRERRKNVPQPCVHCEESTGRSAAQEERDYALCIQCRIAGFVMVWHRGELVLEGKGFRRVLWARPAPAPEPEPADDHERWKRFFAGVG